MRVKISYGMNLAEVPIKSADLVREACTKLQAIIRTLEHTADALSDTDQDFDLPLQIIEGTRSSFTAVDETLADVQSILIGLNNYYNGEQNVSDGRPIMDSSGDTTAETTNPREG